MQQVFMVYQCGLFIGARIYKPQKLRQTKSPLCFVCYLQAVFKEEEILERMNKLEPVPFNWQCQAYRVDCKLKIFKHALWLREQAHHNYKDPSHISTAVPSRHGHLTDYTSGLAAVTQVCARSVRLLDDWLETPQSLSSFSVLAQPLQKQSLGAEL